MAEGARAGHRVRGRLYGLLRSAAPDVVLSPIAVDVERGWLLLPDGGRALGEGPELVGTLVRFLPRYAQLQRELAPRVGELLALGSPTCARR